MSDDLTIGIQIRAALDNMGATPRPFDRHVKTLAELQEIEIKQPTVWLQKHIESSDVNSSVFMSLGEHIRRWDRETNEKRIKNTEAFSKERREVIYSLLGFPAKFCSFLNSETRIPILQSTERPIVISDVHEQWYSKRTLNSEKYWKAYSEYLQKSKGWGLDSITELDHSTDDVVRRLADPCGERAYSSRGLVVGYVQSGKTANFSGVLAKAADAGYRFIIVLAGTLNILRAQTQRRLDKELIGKELVGDDYKNDADWNEFRSFGYIPSEIGSFDWERLTGPEDEYKELKLAIAALDFRSRIQGRPYNYPENLQQSPVRVMVIKKNPSVLKKVSRDLARIRRKLTQIPTLIVDDESDQASINTLLPTQRDAKGEKLRTETNKEIVGLLKVLPRAQYIGYTATPFANALIDPSDSEDLFPKDFMVSIPRPKGYMGVHDFHDWDSKPEGFESNEEAYVRNVYGEDTGGDQVGGKLNRNHLQHAIDSFVLAGAIKLYRAHISGGKLKYKHHTMLVHHSVATADHRAMATKVSDTFADAGYHTGDGLIRLKKLFKEDFAPVSKVKGKGLPSPSRFDTLAPFIAQCLAKLAQGKTVLVVNGDNKDDTPDFDRGPVWAILVGGTKLSRGYTVEGLTTTYFRRIATTTDTLMQMGRWFGYRPDYGDLVRLYLGRDEPFGSRGIVRLDLYHAFECICRDEEEFREELRKYEREGITPSQVPAHVPSHLRLLRPTAKNKMHYARISYKNFGSEWREPAVTPTEKSNESKKLIGLNQKEAEKLLLSANLQPYVFQGKRKNKDGKVESTNVSAYCGNVTNKQMLNFLNAYKWEGSAPILYQECEFIKDKKGLKPVNDWLVLVPTIKSNTLGEWPSTPVAGIPRINIQERTRIAGARYKAFTTSSHRSVADYICGETSSFVPNDLVIDKLKGNRRGVMLLYPVKSSEDKLVTVGFALLFPKNSNRTNATYTVVDTRRNIEVEAPLKD